MTYDQAAAKGHKIQGAIKCTYAEFTWKDNLGEKLFTIQRRSTSDKAKLKAGEKMLVQTGERSFQLVSAPEQQAVSGDDYLLEFDHAIVQTDTQAGLQPVWHQTGKTTSRKFIPVQLLSEARELLIKNLCRKQKQFRLYATYKRYENGFWLEGQEQIHDVLGAKDGGKNQTAENAALLLYEGWVAPSFDERKKFWELGGQWDAYLPARYFFEQSDYRYNPLTFMHFYKYLPDWDKQNALAAYSLWNVAMWTFANCGDHAGIWYWGGGIQQPVTLPAMCNAAKVFAEKYYRDQHEALEFLVYDPVFGKFIEEHKKQVPFIFTDIKVPGVPSGEDVTQGLYVSEEYRDERSKKLYDMLQPNADGKYRWFYVKECAMDWQNTTSENETIPSGFGGGTAPEIDPTTGKPYTIEDYVDLCRQQVEKEKKILAAAGLSNIF